MTTKKCPFCAEEIKEEAIKCKHCKSMLEEVPHQQQNKTEATEVEDVSKEQVETLQSTQTEAGAVEREESEQKWGIGAKLVFVATAIAIFSFFIPWYSSHMPGTVYPNHITGIEEYAFIYLVFYIYPLFKAVRGVKTVLGIISAAIITIFSLLMVTRGVSSLTIGAYVFFFASCLLLVGIWIHKR